MKVEVRQQQASSLALWSLPYADGQFQHPALTWQYPNLHMKARGDASHSVKCQVPSGPRKSWSPQTLSEKASDKMTNVEGLFMAGFFSSCPPPDNTMCLQPWFQSRWFPSSGLYLHFPQPVWMGWAPVWLLPDLFSGVRQKLWTPLSRLQGLADQGLKQLSSLIKDAQ